MEIKMKELLLSIEEKAKERLATIENEAQLEAFRVEFLGKKGELTLVLRGMGKLSPEERPEIGKLANIVREDIEGALLAKQIKKCELVAYEDLGAEALRRLYVEDMPLVVIIDSEGNNLYETGRADYLKKRNG